MVHVTTYTEHEVPPLYLLMKKKASIAVPTITFFNYILTFNNKEKTNSSEIVVKMLTYDEIRRPRSFDLPRAFPMSAHTVRNNALSQSYIITIIFNERINSHLAVYLGIESS